MLIITANANQAFHLGAIKPWSQMTVLSLSEAIKGLWQNSKITLLHAAEQNFIWQQCIESYNTHGQFSAESLAKIVDEAWWLMKHWQISWHDLQQSQDPNTQWFCLLAEAFANYCKLHQCLSEAELLTRVTALVDTNPEQAIQLLTDKNPEKIIFYGFLSFTPLQKKFIQALKKSTCPIEQLLHDQPDSNQAVSLHIFEQAEDELDAAIHWLSKEYIKNPKKRIALIIPELAQCRDVIESRMVAENLPESSWYIFSPPPLLQHGMVQTALALLQLGMAKDIEINQIISLLRSPYFGQMPEEKIDRAKLADQLRALKITTLSWDVIMSIAATWPKLQSQLFVLQKKKAQKKQSLIEWINAWKITFQQLGFPNEEILIATEIQLYQRFNLLLDEAAVLLPWENKLSFSQAINFIMELCKKTYWDPVVFRAQDLLKTIVITNAIDALGLNFTQAWLMSATQNNLPFKLTTNAVLDKKIQYKYGILAVNFKEQDQLTLACYQQLKKNNKIFRVSYAKEDQGKIKSPALFCATLEVVPYQFEQNVPVKLSYDKRIAALTTWSGEALPGGSSALKSQRLCSMQAFAKYRLNLAALAEPVLGLTAIERGIIVHRALQLVWQKLQAQINLLGLEQAQLQQLVARVLKISLRIIPWLRRRLLPKALLDLELGYLTQVLMDWLALEATRPAFKIFALEQEIHAVFAGHTWRLRVDRIDQLDDGRLLLIDYKTGSTSVSRWKSEELTEPQLPLYLVAHAAPIDAITFAEVSSKQLRMIGLSKAEMNLGKLGVLAAHENWDELKSDWQKVLEQVTHDFVISDAKLDPLEGATTCQQCGLQAFCRVFEWQ